MNQQSSRAQSPKPQQQPPPKTMWHTRPHLAGALVGAAGAIPLTLIVNRYRAPIGKFISHTGNYMKRAGYNMFQALKATPFKDPLRTEDQSPEAQSPNHVNTGNEKNFC